MSQPVAVTEEAMMNTNLEAPEAIVTAHQRARGTAPDYYVDEGWLRQYSESAVESARRIVDPHHHLWDRSGPYFIPELLADLNAGHNVVATVYVEGGAMYRNSGDPDYAPVGEVEYANGVAAAFASGYYGNRRACAGIVGKVDLRLGKKAGVILEALLSRTPERLKGIRQGSAWDPSPLVSSPKVPPPRGLLLQKDFQEGFTFLERLNLTFDSFCFHTQLEEVVVLADRFPATNIIVNHIGGRIHEGPYQSIQPEVRDHWLSSLRELAKRANVFVKVGGLNGGAAGLGAGNPALTSLASYKAGMPPTSDELSSMWKPDIDVCVEIFGADRCMFESNFPVDKGSCSYVVLWNAFKKATKDYSEQEKEALFWRTAVTAYRLQID
jgi:predicted TIM-barrel fold metal-dependent hydrolase